MENAGESSMTALRNVAICFRARTRRFAVQSLRWLSVAALLLGTLAGIAPPSRAQGVTGDLLGTVTDASGGVLSGAKVTITNTGTQLVWNGTASNFMTSAESR
jgi:hypothetical protein